LKTVQLKYLTTGGKKEINKFLERKYSLEFFLFLVAVKQSSEQEQRVSNKPCTTNNASSMNERGTSDI
jgi:hypothetical protein